MGRLYLQLLLLCATCIFACGCETVAKIIGPEDEHVDEAADGAVWIDPVPRVRKGVVVLVQVGAGSAQPVQMRAQVDQNGEITLPYLLQEPVLCEGLTLEALKKKLSHNVAKDLEYNKQAIKNIINNDLMAAYYFQRGATQNSLRHDKQMDEAMKLIADGERYAKILNPKK